MDTLYIIRIMHLLLQIGAYALMHRKMVYVMLINLNVYVDKVQGLRLQKYSQNVGKIFDQQLFFLRLRRDGK